MTFADVEDLLRLLDENPRLKAELRARLFEEEWQPFMKYVRETLAASLASIEDLKLRIDAHDKRIAELETEIRAFRAEVRERFDSVDQRFDAADKRSDSVDKRFDGMDSKMDRMQIELNYLRGSDLERLFNMRAPGHLGQLFRNLKVMQVDQIPDLFDAYDSGRLSEQEYNRLVMTDAIVRGRRKESQEIIYIVVEVSTTIDEHDVTRAVHSAEILRKLNLVAEPLVFGQLIREQAQALADASSVTVVLSAASNPA